MPSLVSRRNLEGCLSFQGHSPLFLTGASVMADAPSIYYALAAVKKEIGAVGKDSRNTMQNFNFRGVDAVVNAVAPELNKQGVITVPYVLDSKYETVEIGSKRTPMAHVVLKVAYYFYGPGGDSIQAVVVSESMDSGDKAFAKAMSVAYRTVLLQVLNLPTDEPDPDATSFERSSGETKPAAAHKPRSTETTKTAEWEPKDAQELAEHAGTASSVAVLRDLYRRAGAKAWLKEKVANKDGEQVVLETLLQKLNDDIAHPKSTAAPAGRTRGGGDK